MPDALEARRPLGALVHEPPRSHGVARTVRLLEQTMDLAFTLRFDASDDDAIAAVDLHSGLRLDDGVRSVVAADCTALWLGPGEWLVRLASNSTKAGVFGEAIRAHCATIDASDLWFVVRLQGPCSRHVLAKGCGIDLWPQKFPPGMAAVTQLARTRALIHHVDPSPAYDVYVERSYAEYLWAWLVDAMREFHDSREG